MRVENIEIYFKGFHMDTVAKDLGIDDYPEDMRNSVLFLTKDTFESLMGAFDPTVRWNMYYGCVTLDVIVSDSGVFIKKCYELPDDIFLDEVRDVAVSAVRAPLFGKKMDDGMSSPLRNKVEEIVLYLPKDEFNYLED